MKSIPLFRLLLQCLAALAAVASPGSTLPDTPGNAVAQRPMWVIAVSPFLHDTARQETFQETVRLLVAGLPLDSSLAVVDAQHLRTIARIDIPRRQAFTSEKTRLNQFAEPIRLIRQFLASHPQPPAGGETNCTNSFRCPQALDFVAEQFARPDVDLHVILVGSPLYLDPREPGFSMTAGFFPSDAHLLVSREKSVYGTRGRDSRLRAVRVDWAFIGDPWETDLHRERIQRFWRLLVDRQGGRLAAFASDLPSVFRASLHDDLPPTVGDALEPLDLTTTKLEMLHLARGTEANEWITADLVRNAAAGPPTRPVGPLKIGIRWKGDLDLDLYARPGSGRERLYFEHPRSPEGYYFKDHRTSPERDYEFIEFTEPVDVRELQAAVNFYEGTSDTPVRGELRVEFEGRIHQAAFEIAGREGNQGREGHQQERWWARIDVADVLGLGRARP